jgi:hypothetical protein
MIYRLNAFSVCQHCGSPFRETFTVSDESVDEYATPNIEELAMLIQDQIALCPECRETVSLEEFCDFLDSNVMHA